ncbi:MAG: hypothetical protein K0R50_772 [Eubacterium sp.]|nr:hypothetical protein [Eubacterium sp.]
MAKRILAWVLLAGFILLLLNIIVFQVFLMQSVAVYAVIAIWFVFTNKPLPSNKIIKTAENGPDNTMDNTVEGNTEEGNTVEDNTEESSADFEANKADVNDQENK